MPSQSTQYPSIDHTGYGSDVSQGRNRRSSRVTTPIKRPGMIQPSPDSRRSIGQPQIHTQNNPTNKRKTIPSDCEITPTASKKQGKKKKKNTPVFSQSTADDTSSQYINLAQDSDEENSKVKNKHQQENPEFDHIKKFFSEPFRRKEDVSESFTNIIM